MPRGQADSFLSGSVMEPRGQEDWHLVGRGSQEIPAILVALPNNYLNTSLPDACVALARRNRRVGPLVLMHDPRGSRDMIAGHDERPRGHWQLRKQHQNKPFMYRRRGDTG